MTELEKEAAQRLEKIRINSSYYRLFDNDFDLFDAYGVKDVNSFMFNYKLQQKRFERKQRQTLDEKSARNSSTLRNMCQFVQNVMNVEEKKD